MNLNLPFPTSLTSPAHDVVELLYIKNLVVKYAFGPGDTIKGWKNIRFVAQILIDGVLLDETDECPPIFHESANINVARWELDDLQVPTECNFFTIAFTTQSRHRFFEFPVRASFENGEPDWLIQHSESFLHNNFHVLVALHYPPTKFYQHHVAGSASMTLPRVRVLKFPVGQELALFQLHLTVTDARQLASFGIKLYCQFLNERDQDLLNLASSIFERALEDPDADPDLSQIVQVILLFLDCAKQDQGFSPRVAFQVLQAFPGIPGKYLDFQVIFLEMVRETIFLPNCHDYLGLATTSIAKILDVLLSFDPLDQHLLDVLHMWTSLTLVFSPISDMMDTLPIIDLAIRHFPDVKPSRKGPVSLTMLMAIVHLGKCDNHPCTTTCIDTTMAALELVMGSISPSQDISFERSHAQTLPQDLWLESTVIKFSELAIRWLKYCFTDDDRPFFIEWALRFTSWHLSTLFPTLELQIDAQLMHHRLSTVGDLDKKCWGELNALSLKPRILDEQAIQFITQENLKLFEADGTYAKALPTEYPGAIEFVRSMLSMTKLYHRGFIAAMLISRSLRLPETFQVYSHIMSHLASTEGAMRLCDNNFRGQNGIYLALQDAVSYASEIGDTFSALKWADQSLSNIWSWHFHSRLFGDQIRSLEPYLALKFAKSELEPELGWGGHQLVGKCSSVNSTGYVKIPGDWRETVMRATRLPGCDRFLQPKLPAEIMSLASTLGGPIVYIVPNRYSSHALAVLPGLDDIVHILLPNLHYRRLHNSMVEFVLSPQNLLREEIPADQERLGFLVNQSRQKVHKPPPCFPATSLLAQLWRDVVKPVLHGLGIQRTQANAAEMPRIWWCPSGPLSNLPIHAAGIYEDDGEMQEVISDYVVSSYFPSASALAHATRPEYPTQRFTLLMIANPTGARLPGTETELQNIRGHLETKALVGGEVTIDAVKGGMEDASWVHFACHGVAKPEDPMDSALILANGARLTLREISDMSLPHAEFAFLSACQTARGLYDAPEQSAHLSAGMLACGYRSVIGTMWKISDEYAPIVANRVYEKMLEGGRPNYKLAAYALHDAVQALRKEYKVSYETWVPFIHIGV